ncbi:MAG TPA: hypothetical protein VH853_14485 [Polyangia bacterium]|jgi:hypothetical protein|nr:hypothetical protein [Polyangia bacterium]
MATLRLWLAVSLSVLAMTSGCAAQRVDPRLPGDRCLYSCPDGMTCTGTTYARGHANPGQCQLVPHRCLVGADCRPREQCVRPGEAVGVCNPQGLL